MSYDISFDRRFIFYNELIYFHDRCVKRGVYIWKSVLIYDLLRSAAAYLQSAYTGQRYTSTLTKDEMGAVQKLEAEGFCWLPSARTQRSCSKEEEGSGALQPLSSHLGLAPLRPTARLDMLALPALSRSTKDRRNPKCPGMGLAGTPSYGRVR